MNSQDSEKTIARLTNTIDVYKQLVKEKNQIIGAAKKISPDTIEKAKAMVETRAKTEITNMKSQHSEKTIARLTNSIEVYKQLVKEKHKKLDFTKATGGQDLK